MRISRRKRHQTYAMWSSCQSCGFRPQGTYETKPTILRFGKSDGLGARLAGYRNDTRDQAAFIDLVGSIAVYNHRSAQEQHDFEVEMIKLHNPPFNYQHNDEYHTQAGVRADLLGVPLSFTERRTLIVAKAIKAREIAARYAIAAGAGAAVASLGIAVVLT